MNDLIVIPQLKNSIIARVENEVIIEIGKIEISLNSKSVITDNNLIVSLCFESKTLNIHNIEGELLLKKGNSNFKAINYKNNIVYLGGEYKSGLSRDSSTKGEMFSIINLEKVNIKMMSIDLPIQVIEGKSIDDILINGTELILVDNCVYPKYLIKYDISSPANPFHLETRKLPNNGTYEHIIKGEINNDWIILFSSSVEMGGGWQHITVNGKTKGQLNLEFAHSFSPNKYKSYEASEKFYYLDISLINNQLYILRTDGLGYIDLNKKISNENFKLIKTNNSNVVRIIKSKSEKLIAINEIEYDLIK